MDTLESNNEEKFVLANHGIYFWIAKQSFREATQIMREEHPNEQLKSSIFTMKEVQKRNIKANIHSTISVIFSALSAEAFINYYAVNADDGFSCNYFKTHLDKLDVISKWIVIPKLLTGKSLDHGDHSFEKLKFLIKSRNKLAHFKATTKKLNQLIDINEKNIKVSVEENTVLATIIEASSGIEAVRGVVNALKKIDQSVENEWLDKCQIISTLDYVKII